MFRFLDDALWAVQMFRARRVRRVMGFTTRKKFDDVLRPTIISKNPPDEAVVAYPDAIYAAKMDDFVRARAAARMEARYAAVRQRFLVKARQRFLVKENSNV